MFRLAIISKQASKVCTFLKKPFVFLTQTIPLLLLSHGVLAAEAEDLAADLKPALLSNFGADSTVMVVVYIIEIFSAFGAWWKTKSFGAFIGVVVVSLFANAAISHFVGS